MKKNSFIGYFTLFIIILGVFFIFFHYRQEGNFNRIIKSFTIEGLTQQREDFIKLHQRYISHLKQMESRIKTLGIKLEKKEEMAKTMAKVGDAYSKANYLGLAFKNYKIGITLFPEDSYLNYKIGETLASLARLKSGDDRTAFLKKAEIFYKRTLNLKPTIPQVKYSLGTLYLFCHENHISIGSLKEGLKYTEDYIQSTDDIKGLFLKARIFYSKKDKVQAILTYQAILNLTKSDSDAYKQAVLNINQLES